jgi:hypothetical protein
MQSGQLRGQCARHGLGVACAGEATHAYAASDGDQPCRLLGRHHFGLQSWVLDAL